MVHKTFEERFWEKVKTSKSNECWEWQGSKIRDGYGHIRDKEQKYQMAHRISWQLFNGEIPNGLWVLHKCDNPSCVNPNHLEIGTASKNTLDAYKRGRMNKKGEKNSLAKLTVITVQEIKKLYKNYDLTQKRLAKKFGIGQSAISRIVNNKRWTHI